MGLSGVEIAVQMALYFPDGRRRKHLRSQPIDKSRDSVRQLVEALVDKYNEDHHLLGDLAYEFKDIVCYQTIRGEERCYQTIHGEERCYGHINFIAKAKEADNFNFDIDKLFFAEVMYKQGELFVNCLCMVKHTDNGNCYGCKNKGSADMKHPDELRYIGGHTNSAIGVPNILHRDFEKEETEEDLEAEKARLRWLFGGSHEMKQKGTLTMKGQGDSLREAKQTGILTMEDQGDGLGQAQFEAEKPKRMGTIAMEGQGGGFGEAQLEAQRAGLRWLTGRLDEIKQELTLAMEEGHGYSPREAKQIRTLTIEGQGDGLGEAQLEAEKARLGRQFGGLHEMKQKVTLAMDEGQGGSPREAKRMRTFTMQGQGDGLGEAQLEAQRASLRWLIGRLHEMKQEVTLTMEEGQGDGLGQSHLEAEKARLRRLFGGLHETKQKETLTMEGCQGYSPHEAKRMRTSTMEGQGERLYESLRSFPEAEEDDGYEDVGYAYRGRALI
ncbi:uncharacterized protein LOC100841281 isoform X3 [Brachypodium distachyon]|nr:uncharacterized protein LOC100841281 isoform X3 [Brachypodium distachyon]XP_024310996.1 uncharacterized protein LOC100841281 isoform X3 [Brachypodium distachyon]XP_024311003.1 uncharacterized protein LOC100841281 isoform X3 [Brachypodium distachyon]XP_024311006.1 uncharacterized protein LOC100841281 isoform X3 [Brachypodium distachyon]PNT74748.1 hypothetical protein BRADI_1g21455v3 [Brachypodium distachyon]PNT74750.1 hypothetical protein BRADI_1g21455v3 [Brachypodium distachyon]|eukprot:XP_010235599.1 uncharacterized protein LOC100841281 isoform X3 [Brachypodium distachyon]